MQPIPVGILLLLTLTISGQDFLPNITTNLLTVVRIESSEFGVGSGFIVNSSNTVYLATAKHVLFGKNPTNSQPAAEYFLHLFPNYHTESPSILQLVLSTNLRSRITEIIRVHPNRDVALARIGMVQTNSTGLLRLNYGAGFSEQKAGSASIHLVSREGFSSFDSVDPAEEVFLWGFPSIGDLSSIGAQWDPILPLISRGIISGKDKARTRLLLQCPVFPGNSGGPVIVKRSFFGGYKLTTIGIVTQFVPFQDIYFSKRFDVLRGIDIQNSGYSVIEPTDVIFQVIDAW